MSEPKTGIASASSIVGVDATSDSSASASVKDTGVNKKKREYCAKLQQHKTHCARTLRMVTTPNVHHRALEERRSEGMRHLRRKVEEDRRKGMRSREGITKRMRKELEPPR